MIATRSHKYTDVLEFARRISGCTRVGITTTNSSIRPTVWYCSRAFQSPCKNALVDDPTADLEGTWELYASAPLLEGDRAIPPPPGDICWGVLSLLFLFLDRLLSRWLRARIEKCPLPPMETGSPGRSYSLARLSGWFQVFISRFHEGTQSNTFSFAMGVTNEEVLFKKYTALSLPPGIQTSVGG